MNILLHICCGPCALYPLEILRAEGYNVTGFFYNHNIHPYQEYLKRRDSAADMAFKEELKLIIKDEYDLETFLKNVAEAPEKRCSYCYKSRLEECAKKAAELSFDGFSASLLYSRYQKHDEIKELGQKLAEKYRVKFIYYDFRKGWQNGIAKSKELGLYRQQYCGCIYSEKERYLGKTAAK